jgi:hypothetical protein
MISAKLITLGPGMTWATAQSSRNSSVVIQRFFSTNSLCTTANTPPKPCKASTVKETNKSVIDWGRGRSGAGKELIDGIMAV